jgi:ubiquitin-protein ligase E3 A
MSGIKRSRSKMTSSSTNSDTTTSINTTTTASNPVDSIRHDLEQVEHCLESSNVHHTRHLDAPGAGRAVFDSVASALGSIRSRLQNARSSLTAPATAAAATTATDAQDLSIWDLSQRLQNAEQAHTTRVPLAMLQNELDRREESNGSSTSDNQSDRMNYNDGGQPKDDDTTTEVRAKSRRSSTLVASRRVADAATDQSREMEIHEIGGGGVSLPFKETEAIQEEEASEDGDEHTLSTHGDVELDRKQHQQEEPQAESHKEPNAAAAMIGGSTRSGSLSGSLKSFSSVSSVSSVAAPPPPVQPQAILYSWGAGPHTFHDDSNDRNEETARVHLTTRVGRCTIVSVATSQSHSACATMSGEVILAGDNSEGAVDPSLRDETNFVKPHLLELLSMTRIIQVSCGLDHTAAITESRSVLTWGNDQDGQLGHRRNPDEDIESRRFRRPASMVLGAGRRAATIACGHRFTLVLTSRMEVLACGREEITGYNTEDGPPRLAAQNSALKALPLVAIAAGGHHAVVVTAHGTAYAWGVNASGCCGREFPKKLTVPVPIMVPHSQQKKIKAFPTGSDTNPFPNWAFWESEHGAVSLADDVAVAGATCGDEHTVLVTRTGHLLVCGNNSQSQLGLDQERTEVYPVEPITHPMQGKFKSAAAGSSHTLLLDHNGDVWHMGNGKKLETMLGDKSIVYIAAGGSQSVAIAAGPGFDESIIAGAESSLGQQMLTGLEGLISGILKDDSEAGVLGDSAKELVSRAEELFRHPSVVNSLILNPPEIDILYGKLVGTGNEEERYQISKAVEKGMSRGLDAIGTARLLYPESIRCLLIYLQCPLFCERESSARFDIMGDLIQSLCENILGLPFEGYKSFVAWSLALYSKETFVPFLVRPLLSQLNKRLVNDRTKSVPVIVGVLRWLQNAAERADDLASPKDFHSTGIANMEMEALFEDLKRYKTASKAERSVNFYICANSFLMSPSTKRNLLQVSNQVTMFQAAQSTGVRFDAARREFLFNPYFVLAIDRKHMLQQTLQVVAASPASELRKSLKIVFKGEDGVDAGGVTKEFFQLLSAQLFDYNTGMWSMNIDSDQNIQWFNSDCNWNYDGYYLVGVMVGLAVYNSVILDVHFPSAIYRKLLGLPLGMEDMVDADMRKGLQKLLEYEGGDEEDIFCLTFEVAWMDLGVERRRELKPGGANLAVANDNKEEYVMLYVKWLLVDSVQSQYKEFEKGFVQIMETSCMDLLKPEELELLVEGTPELDFDALEQNIEYEGGFDKDSTVVTNLWKFIKNAPKETQLKFLKFSTGSPKAPIGGLGGIHFKVQRAGPDSMQLPTSHTCFNTLLLPDYGDYDKLAERLGRAILECEGFGLQ